MLAEYGFVPTVAITNDADLGAVFVLDAQGEPQGVIGRGLLQRPTGLARDPRSGLLFVADTQVHPEPTPQQIMETVMGAARHVRAAV